MAAKIVGPDRCLLVCNQWEKMPCFQNPENLFSVSPAQTRKICPVLKQSLARSRDALVGLDWAAQAQTAVLITGYEWTRSLEETNLFALSIFYSEVCYFFPDTEAVLQFVTFICRVGDWNPGPHGSKQAPHCWAPASALGIASCQSLTTHNGISKEK